MQVTAEEVVRHLRETDGSGDEEWLTLLTQQVRAYKQWELREVPIAQLSFDVADEVSQYASALKLPIVAVPVDDLLEVIDGRHRASLAAELGKESIRAYIPKESSND